MVKNRYEFWWYMPIETIAIIPIALSVFPIPLAVPVAAICHCIAEKTIPAICIIYFAGIVIGGSFIFYMERKYP